MATPTIEEENIFQNKEEEANNKSIYDVFDKEPEKKEDDSNWIDICHGCLRFFFLIFLVVIILSTAFISRITFHIILINLNPPTIFTSMNKFGGDIVNTTIPFEAADVHISWIWACLLVAVAPSLHQCVYHLKQIFLKGKNIENKAHENDNKNDIFIKCFPSQKVQPLNDEQQTKCEAETSHDHSEQGLGCKKWLLIITLGVIQAMCETVAVFVLLPTFDQSTAAMISVFMTIFMPWILNGILYPCLLKRKNLKCPWQLYMALTSCFYVTTITLYLAFVSVYVSSEPSTRNSAIGIILIAIVIPLFLSVGLWENLYGFQFEELQNRNKVMMFVSLSKTITVLLTFLIVFGIMGGLQGIAILSGKRSSAMIKMLDKDIRLVHSQPFGGDCLFSQPIWIAVISFSASYLCYKFSYYACRTYLQKLSFYLTLLCNIILVPLVIKFGFKPEMFFSKIQNCSIISNDWDFTIEHENTSILGLIIAFCFSTSFCVFTLTSYIWSRGTRIGQIENIFAMPMYAGYAVDITLLLSKRRPKYKHTQKQNKHTDEEQSSEKTSKSRHTKDSQSIEKPMMIPFIYLCATMWHETEREMKTLLRSIFRLNNYQYNLTERQYNRLLKAKKHGKRHLEKTYFHFEAHILFDDAFNENKERVGTGNLKGKKREWTRKPGFEYNDFVKQFIRCVEDTASRFYEVQTFQDRKDFITPYGRRMEWSLKSPPIEDEEYRNLKVPCRLILHLKDKFLIRNKKRWSQVMYMYYLLSYVPVAKKEIFLGKRHNQQESADSIKQQSDLFKSEIAPKTFILALDGDVDFKPDAVCRLLERMLKNPDVGAACGRIIPLGSGPIVWYQKFEYAVSHWLQKATEHVFGCVLCSPGCFSLFRTSALMSAGIITTYTKNPSTALEYIQYDQGEDRLLSTLLLKKDFKLEYVAASDAYTYVPEGFFEFFNQRRRWSPSTLANILEIITNVYSVTKTNKHINKLYLIYHMFLFVASLITPGTIFLMILGATVLAFPAIPTWLAFLINLTLVSIVVIACLWAEDKTQLKIAAVISAIYSLMMVVVLFGLIIDAISSEFCSVTTYFFLYVAGIFFLAALLHPREFHNIIYGALYFLAVPTTSMLLLIYALGNLHVTSWGTRESNKKRRKRRALEDALSCFGLCSKPRTTNTVKKETVSELPKTEGEKKRNDEKNGKQISEVKEQTKISLETDQDQTLADITKDEQKFWKEIIDEYLSPKNKEDPQKNQKLMDLRNGVFAGFVMINAIYITVVFVITQANELNSDVFTVRLPCPNRVGTFDVDPISVVFTITFGLVLFLQFVGMLIHRFSTLTHIVAFAEMCTKPRPSNQTTVQSSSEKHAAAISHIYQVNEDNTPKTLKEKQKQDWKNSMTQSTENDDKKKDKDKDSDESLSSTTGYQFTLGGSIIDKNLKRKKNKKKSKRKGKKKNKQREIDN